MKKYFKVRFGFGKSDFSSIEEGDLKKAMYAQMKGNAVQLGDVFINGKNIISITPHYARYTGWHESYEPEDDADFKQIKRDCPDFNGIMEYHKDSLLNLIKTGQTNLISAREEYAGIQESKNIEISNTAEKLAEQFRIED